MLRIKDISKTLGDFHLNNVSLDIEDGEYMVILGPTGAGKTILLEAIAGIYLPDSGTIELNERDITFLDPKKRKVSMVYQDFVLFPHLSVYDNIAFGLKSEKTGPEEIDRRVHEMTEMLGITHLLKRDTLKLSGGEKQRTAIARALIMKPKILLLDEPLSALEGRTRDNLRKELRTLHQKYKTTVIHVTHNFEEVFSLADRVAIMNDGEIIQVGEPDEVFSKPNSPFTASFVGAENIFRGTITSGKGSSIITVGNLKFSSSAKDIEGEVYASVRPEEIMLSKMPIDSSARNSFAGIITSITNNGSMIVIEVDVGIPFITILTKRGLYDIGIAEGDTVYLTFKAAAVHVFY